MSSTSAPRSDESGTSSAPTKVAAIRASTPANPRTASPSGVFEAVTGSGAALGRASLPPGGAGGPAPARIGRGRILIVEDEALIALDLERRLLRMGYEVVGIGDNRDEAVALFVEHQPEIVLMDISIRGPVDGIETARAITQLGDVPIIFLTAYADDDTVRRAAEISPYGYLLKPFDERTLSATLSVAFERHASDTGLRLLGAAVDSATVGILLVDARGVERAIVYCNDAFLSLSGLTREAAIGRRPCFLAEEGNGEVASRLDAAIETRVAADGVTRGVRASGEVFWTSVSVSPVASRNGQITHMLVFHVDITRQRAAESALADSQRLALVGRLTAGIAHDMNNVLGAIVAFADLARTDLGEDHEQRPDLDEVVHAAQRGALLTRKLLDFSRHGEVAGAPNADLVKVLGELRPMAERLAGANVALEFHLALEPMTIGLDATSLEQIVLNLIVNARDAMPRGGKVTVTAQRPAEAMGPFSSGRYARLAVSDTGTGIPPETLAKIFEPFFTTKPHGVGAGLGLSTCRMLVDRAGGTIRVSSEPGVGTTFVIELPLKGAEEVAPVTVDAAGTRGSAAGARCLLVEDEAPMRRACERALREAGFEVIGVGSGEEACRFLDEEGAAIDLILCDMVLPGLGGEDVLAHARTAAPRAAALVMSGYFDQDLVKFAPGVDVLWKPFTMEALTRRAIEAKDAGSLVSTFPPPDVRAPSLAPRPSSVPAAGSADRIARLQHALARVKSDAGALAEGPPVSLATFETALAGLSVAFQPVVRADGRTLFGYEALLRGVHPQHTPLALVAMAERLDRVRELGRAVRTRIAATLAARNGDTLPVFVNVHPLEVQHGWLLTPDEPLRPHAARVVLDLTERAQLGSSGELSAAVRALRAAGYRVALDDLGEGFGGLAWLVTAPPDVVKLDLGVVRGIETSPSRQDFVRAVLAVARPAGALVLAEGVESQAEASMLVELGCDLLQGFHFGRPAPYPGQGTRGAS
jgi:two-component system cell cycle sensor histidine kinase/response regulator CckA